MKNLQSRFFCTQCGREGIPIMRKQNSLRGLGHLKKLYCIYCQKEVNHVEIREDNSDYTEEDFKLEFKLGRFKNGIREDDGELPICSEKECEFNILGKCWNSNDSKKCKYKPR